MTPFACAKTRTTFDAWLDGALPPDDAAAVADHLASCALCAVALADDVRLGETLSDALRSPVARPAAPAAASSARFRPRVAAAAVVLAAASFFAGRSTGPESGSTAVETSSSDATFAQENHERLQNFEPEKLGVFMPVAYAQATLHDAERDGIALKYSAAEARRIRAELELAARRKSSDGPVDASAVVAELAKRVREHAEAQNGCEVYRRVRAASRVLAGDRAAGLAAAQKWLAQSGEGSERRAAVRLIAALDPAAAFDALVAEAERGPARDVALDGLLRAADERARPIFAKIADDLSAEAHLRARALGGLHRLGDAAAAERLAALFREQDDRGLRRRIVYLLAARPTPFVGNELPQLAAIAGMELRDRRFLADCVATPGDDASRALSERLIF